MYRGNYEFDVDEDGNLKNSAYNLELLRKLWLDRDNIDGDDIGPGDPGDFDNGAWHVACHLLGGGGVRKLASGKLAWLQVSHDRANDRYFASATVHENKTAQIVPLELGGGTCAACQLEASRLRGRHFGRPGVRPLCVGPALPVQFVAPAGFRSAGGDDAGRRPRLGTLVHAARHQTHARDRNVSAERIRFACRCTWRPLHPLRRTRTAGIWSPAAIARHGPRRAGRTGVSDVERKADGDFEGGRAFVAGGR